MCVSRCSNFCSSTVGISVGVSVGTCDGALVGKREGHLDGGAVGVFVGAGLGRAEGISEGASDGGSEGVTEGAWVGTVVGNMVGSNVGSKVGACDGMADGTEVSGTGGTGLEAVSRSTSAPVTGKPLTGWNVPSLEDLTRSSNLSVSTPEGMGTPTTMLPAETVTSPVTGSPSLAPTVALSSSISEAPKSSRFPPILSTSSSASNEAEADEADESDEAEEEDGFIDKGPVGGSSSWSADAVDFREEEDRDVLAVTCRHPFWSLAILAERRVSRLAYWHV